jgi:cytochrome c biogenesis protein CcmG/thiol:disulfide interchange protein DsbE
MSRFLVPLGFILLVILLGVGLTLDPREVPSPLIGKPAPPFTLPTLAYPDQIFSPSDMKGKVWMLNVWATWCNACRAEHDTLLQLRETNAVVVGLNYKDDSETAARLLQQLGDPYLLNAVDIDGRAAIDWGVYGAPETFIIDKQGIIRHKHIGPLTPQILHQEILPMLTQLNGEQG